MKKLVLGSITLLGTLLLAGCGAGNKEAFQKEYDDQTKAASATFEMKLTDLSLESDDTNASIVSMVAAQLKDITISGDVAKDEKTNASETKMKIKALGKEIPITAIGKGEDTYISTDYIESVFEIMSSFTGETSKLDKDALNAIKGKFISTKDAMENLQPDKKTTQDVFNAEEQKKIQEFMNKEFKALDEKAYTKKDDTITLTFGKKEMVKVMEDYAKEFPKNAKDVDTKAIEKSFQSFEVKMSYDTKSHKGTTKIKIATKKEDDIPSMKIALTIDTTASDKKKTIKLPAKSEIISQEDLEKATAKVSTPAQTTKETTEISEEDFNEVLGILKEQSKSFTKEEIEEALKIYKDMDVFTDEQIKKLEEALGL
ncbi:hypothetical protein SAMN02745116_02029 [Pilibacter termitis]|uniref:Lipoprotein n=1 Tax=Pilibacter termitis TaxID=263852 RepID=A0A1T4Q2F1_9ENTE|nr:hypothetical protein [Pilibacter termitis]SJZ97796.1 hypothetical protein SAMN02745116_02029 [Pilibacter termitis]